MISASRQTPVQDAFRIGESHHVEPSLNSVIGPGDELPRSRRYDSEIEYRRPTNYDGVP